ncbi:MAG TPA: peptidoglycan DD-metalloendopeptidase family protein [Anaeromyxobacter sp.]|nr:peptidoglycan DD-metalloendopeptidase family protein [Anaeromyxobacter sp.]
MTLTPPGPAEGADPRLHEAARSLESLLLRQVLQASGAFHGSETAGSGVRADLFVETLADAVAKGGGIGLADQLERSLGGGAAPAPAPGGGPALAVTPRLPRLGPGNAPLAGTVTSPFGERTDPFTGARAEHDGVDVGAPEGTPIRASAAGVVRAAGERGGYGNAVEIDHGHGLVTLYGHAADLLVHPGDRVEAGQPIATVGSTGRSTGPHLHFEVRMGGRPVDPARVLKVYAQRADDVSRSGP